VCHGFYQKGELSMSKKKIRIGIDVGGTFTHAVAISVPDNKVVAHAVTPTTHIAKDSVAKGIICVFQKIMAETKATPDDVCFVAHSTTQATNALLEGDVAKVGIVGMGSGIGSMKAKSDTHINRLEFSPDKYLNTSHIYLNTDHKNFGSEMIHKAISTLKADGCEVIVASEAFGVDDARNEQSVLEIAAKDQLPATASHEISQLYGLKVRTRTAVVNASILPKMTATALLTDASIKESGITAPLMVMRSDGGVMDLKQMKQRPILTMLSGPSAGIAAALMFAKISDGIFLEVCGTSTDISAIKNGKAMIKSASVGGHLTYLKTLDSRTVGIGGGSMVRMQQSKISEVGPRSAHIAGLPYLAFCPAEELQGLRAIFVRPMSTDPKDYLVVVNRAGKRFAVTLTDAAIAAGITKEGDYAFGNYEAVCRAFDELGAQLGLDGLQLAQQILDKAIGKVRPVVETLLDEYNLDKEIVSLVGGGGGCTVVVPWLSEKMRMHYLIIEKAEVISAIGAALAMLRDTVERTVVEPEQKDIVAIRREAIERMEAMGADPNTIEVMIEVDANKNILRAIVTGALPMDKNVVDLKPLLPEEVAEKAAMALKVPFDQIVLGAKTQGLSVFSHCKEERSFFGLMRKKEFCYRVLDDFGVVKLQCTGGAVKCINGRMAHQDIMEFVESKAAYSDVGMLLPEVFILYKSRIADYSSILEFEQLKALAAVELEGIDENEPVVVLVNPRKG